MKCNKCHQTHHCKCKPKKNCGCKEKDSKCVIYNGECLSVLEICAPEDLERIIVIIDEKLKQILDEIEKQWLGINTGGGAEVYSGKNTLGVHMFKTMIDSVSVKAEQHEKTISFSIDEEWLEQFISDVVDYVQINSPKGTLNISGDGESTYDIDINTDIFVSPNESIHITTSNVGDATHINFVINESFISKIIQIENIGNGTQLYKGKAGNKEQFRTLTTQVVQPIEPGQLTGDVSADFVTEDNEVKLKIDFSDFKVPIQQTGIPEYYVHNEADASIADGSIVRPYRTWDACKTAIIGNGTFYQPEHDNVRVTFMTDITSNEDLTIRNVTYNFQNNSIFVYTGSTPGAIDMEKMVNSPSNSSNISIQGTGEIQAYSPNPNLSAIVVRASGNNLPNQRYTIRFLGNSYITLRELYPESLIGTYIEATEDGAGGVCKNRAGGDVYVVSKTGEIDNITVNEGVLSVKGRNTPVSETVSIEPTATLRIASGVNRAIYIQNGVVAGYSSIVITSVAVQGIPNSSLVRYGDKPDGVGVGRYKPSTTVSHILIDGQNNTQNSSLLLYGDGSLTGQQLGGTNQGGYKATVELKGQANLQVQSSFTWSDHTRYNYLFYITDTVCPGCPSSRRTIQLRNAYTRVNPEKYIIGGVRGVDDSNTQIYIGNGGDIEAGSLLTSAVDKIYEPTVDGELTITSPFMILTEKPYSSYGIMNFSNDIDAGNMLKKGMMYKTTETGSTYLKITN